MDDELVQQLTEALWRSREAREKTDAELHGLRDALRTLIDILVHKEVLSKAHTRVFDRVLKRGSSGSDVALRLSGDKYSLPELDIDCLGLAHLCHMRCCSLKITLSEQDMSEGGIEWELREPYILKRRADGYCTYITRGQDSGCSIYERRPATCREYDCREDKRIWIDFEKRIPAPMPDGLIPVSQLVRDRSGA